MSRLTLRLGLASAIALTAGLNPAQAAMDCAALANMKIPASELGLPSKGAQIDSAKTEMILADPAQPEGMKNLYCKVLGSMPSTDPTAQMVKFEVNLPMNWNGKGVHFGGGGSNGVLVTGLGPLRDARLDTPVAVARGFATYGTDSGHQNDKLPEPGAYSLNKESLVNMAYASYKKTRDAAKFIVTEFYGRAPTKLYFYGGSEGGREALMFAQRFPDDYDGIVAIVPQINYTGTSLVRSGLLELQAKGGWMNEAKVKLIGDAVNASCDKLDGLADGVIANFQKCQATFDVTKLRCPDGKDTGNSCLSDIQIEADLLLHRPFTYPWPLANGITSFPGYTYGSEMNAGGYYDSHMGPKPAQWPLISAREQSADWGYLNPTLRYMIAGKADFNPLEFKPENFAARMKEVSELMDNTNPDLSKFQARGGKLIMRGNNPDYQRSLLQEVTYYESVVKKMGQAEVNKFMRLYVTNGVNHGGDGTQLDGSDVPDGVDILGVLDAWADGGKTPTEVVQVSQEIKPPFKTIASRPMCFYPAFPKYDGKGDPKSATSYSCAKN